MYFLMPKAHEKSTRERERERKTRRAAQKAVISAARQGTGGRGSEMACRKQESIGVEKHSSSP